MPLNRVYGSADVVVGLMVVGAFVGLTDAIGLPVGADVAGDVVDALNPIQS